MEEYKKKYEEAILRMNKWVEGSEIVDPKEVAEFVFPELKESEDEKIRKQIIGYLNRQIDSSDFGGDIAIFRKWIAWLEKQGEQKPQGKRALEVWKDMRLEVYQQASGNRHEPNYSDDSTKMFSLTDIDEIFEKVAEKQGEQKLIDKIQLGKKYKCIASPRYSTFMIGEIYKPEDKFLCSLMNFCSDCFEPIEDGKQKPTWSEDDERCENTLLWIVESYRKNWFNETHKQDADESEKWLKSIRERVQPQPKQEWSEEDEDALDIAISIIQNGGDNCAGILDSDKALNYLKSLKDRIKGENE